MNKNKLKTTDFIQNNKLTTLGALTLIFALTKTAEYVFKTITNEKELNKLTTKSQ